MDAFSRFQADARAAQQLWSAHQEARAAYARARRAFRQARDPFEKALADHHYSLDRSLIEAAAVRLTTAWEVFLRNLLSEYLERRSVSFRRVWRFKGTGILVGQETVDAIVTDARHPFQDLNRAKSLLRDYLGADLFNVGKRIAVSTKPVEELIAVRNAIVHTGGSPTRDFQARLKTRKAAHIYLVSRPGQAGTVPVSQFERLLTGVASTAEQLYRRAWQRPRP